MIDGGASQALAPTGTSDPRLLAKAAGEAPWIEHVTDRHSPAYLLSWREDWLY